MRGAKANSVGRRNTLIVEVLSGTQMGAAAGAGRGATAVGRRSGDAGADALAGPPGTVASCATTVLAADRVRHHHGPGRRGSGRVGAGRGSVVSTRWRDDAAEPGRAHWPVLVVRRA